MVLKKQLRMTTRDFSEARRPSRQITTEYFSVKVIPGVGDDIKYAVVVSTKVAPNATVRNRFRRRVSELLRTSHTPARKGLSVVIIVRRSLPEEAQRLREELTTALEKSGILSQ